MASTTQPATRVGSIVHYGFESQAIEDTAAQTDQVAFAADDLSPQFFDTWMGTAEIAPGLRRRVITVPLRWLSRVGNDRCRQKLLPARDRVGENATGDRRSPRGPQ
jgi:hypothetical protein